MNNLTPVQRHDRNGKLVTRHVKPVGDAVNMGRVPAPKLSALKSRDSITDGIRLYPKQESRKGRSASGALAAYQEPVAFEASDVEMYGVLSVTSPSTALELLSAGVRSAEEAEEWLISEGRSDEFADNAETAHQMLMRRVAAPFFLMGMERLSDEQVAEATPELLHDYLEFFAIRSIMRKESHVIADEVLRGEIALDDVRTVGIDHLKTGDRLEIARPAFKALKQGTAQFTTKDLTTLLKERLSAAEMTSRRDYMLQYGSESLRGLSALGVTDMFGGASLVIHEFNLYGDAKDSHSEFLSVMEYTARIVRDSGMQVDRKSQQSVKEAVSLGKYLFDNGVDAQYAAERILKEDPQMIAASYNGIAHAVSDGWL